MRLFLAILAFNAIFGSKIELSSSNVIDFFGLQTSKPPQQLLDEQSIAGDPLNGNGNPCYTSYLPATSNDWYPITYPSMPGPQAIIDLNGTYMISNICMYISYINDFRITWKFTKENPFSNPGIL